MHTTRTSGRARLPSLIASAPTTDPGPRHHRALTTHPYGGARIQPAIRAEQYGNSRHSPDSAVQHSPSASQDGTSPVSHPSQSTHPPDVVAPAPARPGCRRRRRGGVDVPPGRPGPRGGRTDAVRGAHPAEPGAPLRPHRGRDDDGATARRRRSRPEPDLGPAVVGGRARPRGGSQHPCGDGRLERRRGHRRCCGAARTRCCPGSTRRGPPPTVDGSTSRPSGRRPTPCRPVRRRLPGTRQCSRSTRPDFSHNSPTGWRCCGKSSARPRPHAVRRARAAPAALDARCRRPPHLPRAAATRLRGPRHRRPGRVLRPGPGRPRFPQPARRQLPPSAGRRAGDPCRRRSRRRPATVGHRSERVGRPQPEPALPLDRAAGGCRLGRPARQSPPSTTWQGWTSTWSRRCSREPGR